MFGVVADVLYSSESSGKAELYVAKLCGILERTVIPASSLLRSFFVVHIGYTACLGFGWLSVCL